MERDRDLLSTFSALRGRALLVALSGGPDSVALLSMLVEVREALNLTLFAAHVDHGIRPDSGEDAEFCRQLCAECQVPFYMVKLHVPKLARQNHRGLETEARNQRYAALRHLKASTGADYIALAHHMDDQAETVLMHLSRGSGGTGLGGMRTFSADLYRPLLGFRKEELLDYLRERGLKWREDQTNGVDDNPRNALRLNVIPSLVRSFPGFVSAVCRCADIAQAEDDYLENETCRYLQAHQGVGLNCRWLEMDESTHPALLRRALRKICPEAVSWDRVTGLEALCQSPRGRMDIGRDYFAERTGRRLYFVQKKPKSVSPVPLSMEGITQFAGQFEFFASPHPPTPIRDDPFTQVLNRAALAGAVVRFRRSGDRIRPLGCGDRLLSDYFIDKKVDRPLRDEIPLVAVGNRVHWVCGCGISQEAAVSANDPAVMLNMRR